MKSPNVSVIVPVYNAEKTIGILLDDVLRQTLGSLEVIIVNDGSSDQTANIVSDYSSRDDRIKLLTQKNSGPSAARNKGIEMAKGTYCMFFDADDRIDASMIEKMIARMEDGTGNELVECGVLVRSINKEHSITEEHQLMPRKLGTDLRRGVLGALLRNGLFHSVWNKAYKTQIIRQKNIHFDTTIKNGEDLIFNLSYMSHVKKYSAILEPLYVYQRFDDSDSITGKKNGATNLFAYRKAMYRSLRLYVSDGYSIALLAVRARWFVSSLKTILLSNGGAK